MSWNYVPVVVNTFVFVNRIDWENNIQAAQSIIDLALLRWIERYHICFFFSMAFDRLPIRITFWFNYFLCINYCDIIEMGPFRDCRHVETTLLIDIETRLISKNPRNGIAWIRWTKNHIMTCIFFSHFGHLSEFRTSYANCNKCQLWISNDLLKLFWKINKAREHFEEVQIFLILEYKTMNWLKCFA